jgi:hypothetical protein
MTSVDKVTLNLAGQIPQNSSDMAKKEQLGHA